MASRNGWSVHVPNSGSGSLRGRWRACRRSHGPIKGAAGGVGHRSDPGHLDQRLLTTVHPNRIAQRPAQPFPADLHHVAILKGHAVAETECVGPEEVHVYQIGHAMALVFEVVM